MGLPWALTGLLVVGLTVGRVHCRENHTQGKQFSMDTYDQGWARDNLLASSQHQVDNAKKCKSFCDKQKNGETCV